MQYFSKIIFTALLGLLLFSTTVTAGNVGIGQKIYGTKLKDACGFTGVKFTASHTQKEWQAIYDNGKMGEEVKTLCPKVEIYNEKWNDHLFSFAYEYGKGSGNEPSC